MEIHRAVIEHIIAELKNVQECIEGEHYDCHYDVGEVVKTLEAYCQQAVNQSYEELKASHDQSPRP